MMRFTRAETIHELLLQPRSLLVLRGPARYNWRHGIPRRHSDIIDGRRVPRGRRVSMTFRTVCLD
jgi:alkylated DNA repair dioxygenase AlkB